MHTFDIKSVDDVTLYIAWKMMNLSLEKNHPRFYGFLYDLPDAMRADDFSEQSNMTRSQIYLKHIRRIFQLGLIKNLRIRVIKNVNQGLGVYEVDISVDPTISPGDILLQNRGSEHARFISGEFCQQEAINISGINKINDEYWTCFLFEPDYERIAEYIYQYLSGWGENKIPLTVNYVRPEKQISRFHKVLLDKSDLYGDTFQYTLGDNRDLSEITLILYFLYILRDIEIQDWNDNTMRTNHLIKTGPITFDITSKIKIGLKAATKVTEAKVYFDEKSGIFYDNGVQVGTVPLKTRQFYFLKCLYDNFPKAVQHNSIAQYIRGYSESIDAKLSSQSEIGRFISDIKRNLDKNILAYIDAPIRHYQLLDIPKK